MKKTQLKLFAAALTLCFAQSTFASIANSYGMHKENGLPTGQQAQAQNICPIKLAKMQLNARLKAEKLLEPSDLGIKTTAKAARRTASKSGPRAQ